MFAVIASIVVGIFAFAGGVWWGKKLQRAEGLTPEQVIATLKAGKVALTHMSPEEAARNGETG